MSKINATWGSFIISLALCTAIGFTVPTLRYQARGILLPSQSHAMQAPQGEIKLMRRVPEHYQDLGTLHIERHDNGQLQLAEQQILTLAAKLASARGANAIVVSVLQRADASDETSALNAIVFYGKAIRV